MYISRFLGKIAIEALAQRMIKEEGWEEQLIYNLGLDELRKFVRYGKGYKLWPYNQRQIYAEQKVHFDHHTNQAFELLHEYDFLFPDEPGVEGDNRLIDNIYFVCAIMGTEYTINLTNAGLSKYHIWLNDNKGNSILLMEKGEFNNISI